MAKNAKGNKHPAEETAARPHRHTVILAVATIAAMLLPKGVADPSPPPTQLVRAEATPRIGGNGIDTSGSKGVIVRFNKSYNNANNGIACRDCEAPVIEYNFLHDNGHPRKP